MDEITRQKLLDRLKALNEHLSDLENSKRDLNLFLINNKPSFLAGSKADQEMRNRLNKLRGDIGKVIDEVKGIRSSIQIEIPKGSDLERQLNEALFNRAQTIESMRSLLIKADSSAVEEESIVAALRKESDKTIELIHKAQDAVIDLTKKLKAETQ